MSTLTSGIDVGSSAVKTVVVAHRDDGTREVLAWQRERVRKRDVLSVIDECYARSLEAAGASPGDVAYVATTGEGDLVRFRTGHFYGMTTHARGAIELCPEARAALDIGALHGRAMVFDERSKVLGYRMTSQCASGSGQFLENIGRYLGVALEEVGALSLEADDPERCSSICAVLAETDVINMVSRGIPVPNILKGIHLSMAGRYVKLLNAAKAEGVVLITGGLAADVGLVAAIEEEARAAKARWEVRTHPRSVFAGALGAACWGKFRLDKLRAKGLADALTAGGAS
ncbi:MAG: benzoyl-CoA reductase subunit D [Planctomycetota bacterium]|nr:MAG: benzoyl-CoA reductase subunit D [Planctomycetota bacterium]